MKVGIDGNAVQWTRNSTEREVWLSRVKDVPFMQMSPGRIVKAWYGWALPKEA